MMKIQGKTHRWFSNWWIRGESLCRIQTIGQVCCLLGNPQKTGTSSTDFITWLWRFPTFRMRRNSCLVLVVRTDTLTTPLRSRPIAGSGDPDKWDLTTLKLAAMLHSGFAAHLDGPTLTREEVPTDKMITVIDPPNGRVASLPSGSPAHLD